LHITHAHVYYTPKKSVLLVRKYKNISKMLNYSTLVRLKKRTDFLLRTNVLCAHLRTFKNAKSVRT